MFRASALMDDNVMGKYATLSSQAKHYVQYDQGTMNLVCFGFKEYKQFVCTHFPNDNIVLIE